MAGLEGWLAMRNNEGLLYIVRIILHKFHYRSMWIKNAEFI